MSPVCIDVPWQRITIEGLKPTIRNVIVEKGHDSVFLENGGGFRVSTGWVFNLLKQMGLSARRATTAAQKLPDDWQQKVHLFTIQLAYYVWKKKIPPALVVNLDQAGITIVPVGRNTWVKRGSKSVPLVGQKDKCQITIVPAISAGTAVGMQVIFQGKTERSLPVGEGRRQLDELHVHLTMTSNHWAGQF